MPTPILAAFSGLIASINPDSNSSFRYSCQQKYPHPSGSPSSDSRGRTRDSGDNSSRKRSRSTSASSSSSWSRSNDRSETGHARGYSRSKSPNQGNVPHYFNDLEMEEHHPIPAPPTKQYIEYEFYEFDDDKDGLRNDVAQGRCDDGMRKWRTSLLMPSSNRSAQQKSDRRT